MSEWLGTGLQNRSHQFESGWHLKVMKSSLECTLSAFELLFYLIEKHWVRPSKVSIPPGWPLSLSSAAFNPFAWPQTPF